MSGRFGFLAAAIVLAAIATLPTQAQTTVNGNGSGGMTPVTSSAGTTTITGSIVTTTSPTDGSKSVTASPGAFRNEMSGYAAALGKHLTAPGFSKLTRTGTYTDASGTSQITETWQNPGNMRAVISGAQNNTLVWNGSSKGASQALDGTSNDLLDALADDAPEAFFFSVAQGTAVRLLGTRVRADDGKSANYAGPWYTVYHRVARAPSNNAATAKLFLFDSATGLLHSVRYLQGATPVEVVYSNWLLSGGEYSAGTITRYSGSTVEFTLTFGATLFATSSSAVQFSAP